MSCAVVLSPRIKLTQPVSTWLDDVRAVTAPLRFIVLGVNTYISDIIISLMCFYLRIQFTPSSICKSSRLLMYLYVPCMYA